MASYHRVLQLFDRSVQDKSLECDYDIHPWELLINGERWPGKVRLIGFVDVFFLISYSSDARFEKGLLIYKEDEDIRSTLKNAGLTPEGISLEVANEAERKKDPSLPEKYFNFNSGPIDYTITSLGHEVGMKTQYPKSSLQRYIIKLRKNRNKVVKHRIRRGINKATLNEMMQNTVRLGIITHAEMTAQFLGVFGIAGSTTEDTMKKYVDTLFAANNPGNVALSNERT